MDFLYDWYFEENFPENSGLYTFKIWDFVCIYKFITPNAVWDIYNIEFTKKILEIKMTFLENSGKLKFSLEVSEKNNIFFYTSDAIWDIKKW